MFKHLAILATLIMTSLRSGPLGAQKRFESMKLRFIMTVSKEITIGAAVQNVW